MIDFNKLYKELPFLKKGGKLKFKYQQGGFVSNPNVKLPEIIRNIPKELQRSRGNWTGGYLGEQTSNISADKCYIVRNGKREQVACDSTDANQIVIPPGTTKKGEDEIFKREETTRRILKTKEGTEGTTLTKTSKGTISKDKFEDETNPEKRKGSGEYFKKQGCNCGKTNSSEISIGEFKSKLAALSNKISSKNWGMNLLKQAESKGAKDTTKIKLVYSKEINGEESTLDLALQMACMCGGSGEIIKSNPGTTETISSPGTPPEFEPIDTKKVTKAIKGEYETKLKKDTLGNSFFIQVPVYWNIMIQGRPVTRQATIFVEANVDFDANGEYTGLSFTPFSTKRGAGSKTQSSYGLNHTGLILLPKKGLGYELPGFNKEDNELDSYLQSLSTDQYVNKQDFESKGRQARPDFFKPKERILTNKGEGQDPTKQATGTVDYTISKKQGGLLTLKLKRII